MTSFQTVRLSRGRHSSPEQGACVMELASMLAGERFSDRPQSVCPVIGAYLRNCNDLVDDGERQQLYRYASQVVDTRGGWALTRRRAKLCRARALALNKGGYLRTRLRLPVLQSELTAACAAKAILSSERSDPQGEALELLEELVCAGRSRARSTGDPQPDKAREGERASSRD